MTNAVQTKNVEDLGMLLVEAMYADRHDREESARQYNRDAALMLAVRSRDPRLVEPLVEKVIHEYSFLGQSITYLVKSFSKCLILRHS